MNKKPWVAFVLSFILPGAGLAYLGMWGWGLLNLVIVMGTGVVIGLFVTDPSVIQALGAGLCAGSAVMAKTMAAKRKTPSAPATPSPATAMPAGIPSRGPATLMEIPSAPAKPATTKCSKCGADNEAANFCVECGSPL